MRTPCRRRGCRLPFGARASDFDLESLLQPTTTSDRAERDQLLHRPADHASTCLDADTRSNALPLRQAQ